jgi:hypothetical protein
LLFLSDEIQNNNELAVQLKSAYKSYGKSSILKSLDLNVKRGAMYVLKTTFHLDYLIILYLIDMDYWVRLVVAKQQY